MTPETQPKVGAIWKASLAKEITLPLSSVRTEFIG